MSELLLTYEQMLAEKGLAIGDRIRCDYRHHWLGMIRPVSDDPTQWNGSNSEAQYCLRCRLVRVAYAHEPSTFTQHDYLDNLHKVEGEN